MSAGKEKMPTTKIIIEFDTREKNPWLFETEDKPKSGYKSQVVGCELATLTEGDYRMKNSELIVIEKKAGFGELFGNFSPKANQERFEREMEKLQKFKYKYIVIEGNLSNDILGMSPVQFKYAPPASAILRWLLEIQMKYGVNFIFAGDSGKKVVRNIFEMVVRNECQNQN